MNLLDALREDIDLAIEAREERLADWREAREAYEGTWPGPPAEEECDQGMTSLVSTDVADAVHAVASEIVPAFSALAPVEFVPLSAEDEAQAALETQVVAHVADAAGAFEALSQATVSALLYGAGVVKVWWEERKEVLYQPTEVPLDMLAQAMMVAQGEDLEVAEGEIDEEAQVARGLLRRTRLKSKPRLGFVPLTEFLVSQDADSPNVERVRLVAHQAPVSRSELVELGIDADLVADLAAWGGADEDWGVERTGHESTERVMCIEAFYRVDLDGDGVAELRRVLVAGGEEGYDELLLEEPWEQIPFAVGVPYLRLSDWVGVSLYERLKDVQEAKTGLLREIVNSAKRNLRQRIGVVERDANIGDVLSSQMGGVIRMKTANGIVPVPDVQMPPQTLSLLGYLDEMRRDKGGGAIDTAASAMQMDNTSAHGVERTIAAAERLNAMVALNLCEYLAKPMYAKLHRLLRQYAAAPISVPGSAGWRVSEPAQWSAREELRVAVGMSVGETTRRLQALSQIVGAQMQALQSGQDGVLVSTQGLYRAQMDMARLSGLPAPDQYWVDPQSPQSLQAQQQKAQMAQQQMQAQLQAQEQQAQLMMGIEQLRAQSKMEVAQIKAQVDTMRAHLDAALKALGTRVDLARIEADIDASEASLEVDRLQVAAQVGRPNA